MQNLEPNGDLFENFKTVSFSYHGAQDGLLLYFYPEFANLRALITGGGAILRSVWFGF